MPTLNWIGKEAVINHHLDVPFHLLKDVPDLACGDPGSGNLIVEGDNLLALKALLPYYKGKVKCICIDPPYNTGNEGWAYNDNVNSPAIKKWLGETVGKEGETLDRHDRWLCMMYPRLTLLREFLSEDGSIWIALDDTEMANLRLMMDEIYGAQNFIADIAWEKRYTRSNNAKLFYSLKDHVVVYRKSDRLETIKEPRSAKSDENYDNPDNDPRGPWMTASYVNPATKAQRSKLVYSLLNPFTKEKVDHPTHAWKYELETHRQHVAENRLWWGKSGEAKYPRLKLYLREQTKGLVPVDVWKYEDSGTTDDGGNEIKEIFGKASFDTPKPTRLIERILQIATNPGDLVLDSFAGSGTTGHAVLKMNAAAGLTPEDTEKHRDQNSEPLCSSVSSVVEKKMPARRFILVEMDEKIAPDITRERVKRVAEGYKNAKGEKVSGLGGGFRYARLGETLFDEHGRINEARVRFADLARHVYFTETGEPLPKERISAKTPLLGIHHGRAVYLLYNGILKDKSVDGGNVLTGETLAHLPAHDGPRVVYAAGCRFSKARLEREGITFKQTPYAIRTR